MPLGCVRLTLLDMSKTAAILPRQAGESKLEMVVVLVVLSRVSRDDPYYAGPTADDTLESASALQPYIIAACFLHLCSHLLHPRPSDSRCMLLLKRCL